MVNQKDKVALIVAGEASGDQHGANLVLAIRELLPKINILGIGGVNMERAGVNILVPSSDMAVVGVTEVFSKLGSIFQTHFRLKKILKNDRPDLLILIDYPDFNINLARSANRFKVPTLYYISPQVWAWRKGRIKKIAKRVDRMAVILPFEKKIYQHTDLKVDYVGHPLMDSVVKGSNNNNHDLPLDNVYPVIGLLPGSRIDEIKNLLPLMIESVEILSKHYRNLHCILPLAPTVPEDLVQTIADISSVTIRITRDRFYNSLELCDFAIVASGTAALETAIMRVPMVIIYKVSPISYYIGRMVIKVPHISLVNLIAGEEIVTELIQDEVTAENIVQETVSILDDKGRRERMISKLEFIENQLGRGGASNKTAEIALEMMGVNI